MSEKGALVLVVDDQDALRFVKRQLVARAGFDVIEASTGTEGLALARQRRPDLVLLDINLPDISGLEVARQLKLETPPPAMQIIQVSNTSITDGDRVAALAAGADAYLSEPVDSEVLLATVRAHLRIRRIELELLEAAKREQEARREAERANGLKDEFLAGLSHELRTPMNAIVGWIWQLRHSTMTDAARERALTSLERSARLQQQLINDLLDVSRISRGKMHLEFRIIDVKTAIEAAAEAAGHLAEAKQVALVVNAGSAAVCGDPLRLQQVFTNLLTNAIQFTPPGGTVEIGSASTTGVVTVHVRDNGAGIDQAFLPFVFEKFRQAERGLTRQHGGLGVGLSITQELVALHGGQIAAESEGLGRGATFAVALPGATPALERLQALHQDAAILHQVRVFVAGDHETERAWIASTLEAAGARVHVSDRFDPASLSSGYDVVLVPEPVAPGAVPTLVVDRLSAAAVSPAPLAAAALVVAIADALQGADAAV